MSQAIRNSAAVAMSASTRSAAASRLADHAATWKLRITAMVAITTAMGFVLGASRAGAGLDWLLLLATLAGASLSCMGAAVFNQVVERDADAMMRRTADRPLAAGRLTVGESLASATAVSCLGVGLLAAAANPLAAALSAGTILSYVFLYTPMKRLTPAALFVGAVPGAMPPVIGYAAASGDVGLAAWLLFAIMFVWQVPHFLAIAWLYKQDYARAGMPMIPVNHPEGATTFWWLVGSAAVTLVVGVLPPTLGVGGWASLAAGVVCGGLFLLAAMRSFLRRTDASARLVFFASLVYLPVVLLVLVIDAA